MILTHVLNCGGRPDSNAPVDVSEAVRERLVPIRTMGRDSDTVASKRLKHMHLRQQTPLETTGRYADPRPIFRSLRGLNQLLLHQHTEVKHIFTAVLWKGDGAMAGGRLSIQVAEAQLELMVGDITELDVQALVNSAAEDLQLKGEIAETIREKGGPSIQEECDRIGHTPEGSAVVTGAGKLAAEFVIHAVCPRLGGGDEDRKLQSAVRASLALADKHRLRSIGMPAISTGSFGFPVDRCARILLSEIHGYLQGGTRIERVMICLLTDEDFGIFKHELRRHFR